MGERVVPADEQAVGEATQVRTIRTADHFYAAYLKNARVPLLRTEKDARRVYFVFERPESYEDLQAQYFNRRGKVVAADYADEVRALKSLIYTSSGG